MSFRDAYYGTEDGAYREERAPRRFRRTAGADFLFERREEAKRETKRSRSLAELVDALEAES